MGAETIRPIFSSVSGIPSIPSAKKAGCLRYSYDLGDLQKALVAPTPLAKSKPSSQALHGIVATFVNNDECRRMSTDVSGTRNGLAQKEFPA